METKSIEEIKKSYADEIHRLTQLEQKINAHYKNEYESLKSQENKLLDEYNTQMQKISIGIERLRGAYTALVDFEEGKVPTLVENGMLKDVKFEDEIVNEGESNTTESVEKLTSENNNQESTDEIARLHTCQYSENKITEELKELAHEIVKDAKEKGKVTKYDDFTKTDLAKETSLTPDEVEALKSVMGNKEEPENQEIETSNNVKEEDVPDYLKEEYGLDKK